MLTVEQANELTGHLVMVHDGRKYRHQPARLVRIINDYTASIQPPGHKRLETVAISDLYRHDKSVFEAEQRAIAQRRNRGIDEPGDTAASESEAPAVHLIADLGHKKWWGEVEPGKSDFVPDLKRATLFGSWSKARVQRSKIVWYKRSEDIAPMDIEVVTSERARDLSVQWAKVPDPTAVEPEVITVKTCDMPQEAVKTIGDMLDEWKANNPQPEPEAVTAEPQPEEAMPQKIAKPAPAPVALKIVEKPKGATWVKGNRLAVIARPKSRLSDVCIRQWAEDGKIPEAGIRRRKVGRYEQREYNVAVLGEWIAEQNRLDDIIAGSQTGKSAKRAANTTVRKEPNPEMPKPAPAAVREPTAKHVGAKAALAKSITDAAEFDAMALEAQAQSLMAKAAGVRAEAAMRVESL